MILAVCFREVSAERVAEFEQEVIAEGRMTAPMNKMFRQVSGEVAPGMSKKRSKTLSKWTVNSFVSLLSHFNKLEQFTGNFYSVLVGWLSFNSFV